MNPLLKEYWSSPWDPYIITSQPQGLLSLHLQPHPGQTKINLCTMHHAYTIPNLARAWYIWQHMSIPL